MTNGKDAEKIENKKQKKFFTIEIKNLCWPFRLGRKCVVFNIKIIIIVQLQLQLLY